MDQNRYQKPGIPSLDQQIQAMAKMKRSRGFPSLQEIGYQAEQELGKATAATMQETVDSGGLIYDRMMRGHWRLQKQSRTGKVPDPFHLNTAAVYVLTTEAVQVCLEAAIRYLVEE